MRKQTDHTFELLKHFVVNYLVTSLNSEFDDQSDKYTQGSKHYRCYMWT